MPEYTINPNDIMIKFTGPEDRVVRISNRVNDWVNDRERKMLILLEQDPGFTVTQSAQRMNVSRKTIASYIKHMKEIGVIKREGTSKKGYWKINALQKE